ncbi:MAG: ribonuclease III domain-containing protein [Mycobacteriales bacterium]
MTHASYAEMHGVPDNSTLAWAGDSLVNLVLVAEIFSAQPDSTEEKLAADLSAIRDEEKLANTARHLDLGRYLLLSPGEEATGGRARDSNLATAYQAVMAAVWQDSRAGLSHAQDLVLQHHNWAIRKVTQSAPRNWKQELLAWRDWLNLDLEYLRANGGKNQSQRFYATVVQGGRYGEPVSEAFGRSAKQAEAAAARKAVEKYSKAFGLEQASKRSKPDKKRGKR